MRQVVFIIILSVFISLSGCKTSTPTDTLKSFFTAYNNKDVVLFKKSISTRLLLQMERDTQELNKEPLDEYIKRLLTESRVNRVPEPIEIRGETISDNTATLYWNNQPYKGWMKLSFIKEDGEWKIDADELIPSQKRIK